MFNSAFFVNFRLVFEVLASVASVISIGLLVMDKIRSKKAEPKSEKVLKIIENLEKLDAGLKHKSIYTNEYKRLAFNEVNGVNLDYKYQLRLYRFYKGLKNKYSWYRVKNAYGYFDFSKKKTQVKIPFNAFLGYAFQLLNSIILISAGLLVFLVRIADMVWYKELIYFALAVGAMVLGLYTIGRFLAPINTALGIKKYLKNRRNPALE